MPLDVAAAAIMQVHAEMAKRNDAGEFYLALAIDPGDSVTRSSARFWVFDYGSKSGYRWITYPCLLPGVYFKQETMIVNGHYPQAYLDENGNLISLRTGRDSFAMHSRPILVAYGSTTLIGQLYDDSGKKIKLRLTPAMTKKSKKPTLDRYKHGGHFVLYAEKVDITAIRKEFLKLFIPRAEKLKSKYRELNGFPKEQRTDEFLLNETVLYKTYKVHPKWREGPEGKRPVPSRLRDNLLAFVIDFLCRRIAIRSDRPI